MRHPEPHEVVAVLCSDLHFCHQPPIARSGEKNWYGVMERYIDQLSLLASEAAPACGRVPIVCAGDVCNSWREPPELVNFLLAKMPVMYAVPGQHDLPYHRYGDVHKSSYQTLVHGGKIVPIPPDVPVDLPGVKLHGFPWGFDVTPCEEGSLTPLTIRLAVVHRYLWTKDHAYQGAPKSRHLSRMKAKLKGYDAAVFGDNHKGFLWHDEDTYVLNCGTFLRRRSDEAEYRPCVGLLYGSGRIKRRLLDTSADVIAGGPRGGEAGSTGVDLEDFLEELLSLTDNVLDFHDAVKEYLEKNQVGADARQVMMKALEKK